MKTALNHRTILLVDLNSFFASVEQQANPFLRHRPVGIIKAIGRSCVIACSNEAKHFGLKTGMSLNQVKQLCPQIILVPADFPKYADVTQKFLRLCSQYTDQIEVYSLDEVFLDVTHTAGLFGGPLLLAYDIQQRLQNEVGDWLGCSVGIAKNKFLAKVACGIAPKKAVFVVDDENQSDLLAQVPFEEVWGIGRRLTQRLKTMGITSLPQILKIKTSILQAEFGRFWALTLKRLARGEDNSPLITVSQLADAKSVSRTYTLLQDTQDKTVIKSLIRNLVEEAAWKLRQMGLVGRQFGLTIRGSRFNQIEHVTSKSFTDNGKIVFDRIYSLYNNWHWPYQVRFIGIWISLLTRKNYLPLPLFLNDQRQHKLWQTIDSLNQNFGCHTIHPASMLGSLMVKPEINGFMGDKKFTLQTSWGLCPA